jgi:hypothetical protein
MDTAAIENFAQANGLPIPSTVGKLPPPTGDFMGNDLPPTPMSDLPVAYVPSAYTTIIQSSTQQMTIIAPTKTLFTRGNTLVVIDESDDGRHSIRTMKSSEYRSFAEGHVCFRRKGWDKPSKAMVEGPCLLSKESADAIICCRPALNILPRIWGITSFPRLLADGSLTAHGYDEEAKLFVTGNLKISEPDTVDEACHGILRLLQDFNFAGPCDKARGIAALLAPMLRVGPDYGKRNPYPAFAIEADQSQTGKGTYVKVVAAIYGETPSMVAATRGGVGSIDEAFCKAALRGRILIQLDNLRGQLNSQLFEAFITAAGPIHVRALRTDGEVDTRNFLIFLTSNGLETTVDTANRLLVVRLKKQPSDHQWHRWPEGSLWKHIDANRSHYIGAVCKILRVWMTAGSPQIPCRHDMKDFTGAMNWIVQKLFKLPPLVEDHTEIQTRVAKPGLGFLREVAIRTKKDESKLTVTDMIDLAVEEGIAIPGVEDFPSTDEELKKAKLAVGRLIKPVFADSNSVSMDNFTIERRTTSEPRPDGNGTFQKHVYLFTDNSIPPTRGQWSEALRNAQVSPNGRQQSAAVVHTHPQSAQSVINYGATMSINSETTTTNQTICTNATSSTVPTVDACYPTVNSSGDQSLQTTIL